MNFLNQFTQSKPGGLTLTNLNIMKQPDLGRKIAELRKAKGLTQEELVEKCNISVRTIQRIETGEVTPRSYTVKTILTALDYDAGKIFDSDTNEIPDGENESINPAPTWIENLIPSDNEVNKQPGFLIRQLHLAWVFGIVYFILAFLEGAAEYVRFKENEMLFGAPAYILIKIVLLISFVFFQRGFIVIGGLFDNYLLKIISVILIGANILLRSYDIASVFYHSIEPEIVLFGASLLYGVTGIIYGISLRRLRERFGRIAKYAAAIELIAACFFLTVVLSFVGDIVRVPAELLEIIILFKAIEIIKTEETEGSLA